MQATFLGANGWLLDFGSLRVLVDPWLTGNLAFAPGTWFFEGRLKRPQPVPERVDLLLLSQGLPDHTHAASLALLPRDLAVIASPTAAARARQLGFTRVQALAPGQDTCFDDPAGGGPLRIRATAGAPVPQVENGYLLHHPAGCLYLEPHGYLAADLPAEPLDAVITPVVELGLPVAGAFVRGRQVLPQLIERFSPRTILASSAGEEVSYAGWLSRMLWKRGSAAEMADRLQADAPGCCLIEPEPGRPYTLR
jgi:L-ascorbate metabolism protein UlaG (beta-lactamase superfamily)